MYQPISPVSVLAGFTAFHAIGDEGSAISSAAKEVNRAAIAIVASMEQSQALFGAKSEAISRLMALADEYAMDETIAIQPRTILTAECFLRALPNFLPLPEFSVEPDGAISLDWIESRNRLFSLSVGANNRLAYAWLDGTDKGHGVARFDGQQIPIRVIDGIIAITKNENASFRAA